MQTRRLLRRSFQGLLQWQASLGAAAPRVTRAIWYSSTRRLVGKLLALPDRPDPRQGSLFR